jgi:glutathione synthase
VTASPRSTSPAPPAFQEITQQAGFDVPAMFITALEAALAA